MGPAPPRSTDSEALAGGLVALLRLLSDGSDESIAEVVAQGLLAPWHPELVAVYLLTPDGTALALWSQVGLTPDQAETYSRVPLDVDLPITRGFVSGVYAILRVAEIAADFPLLAPWAAQHPHRDTAEVIGIPLRCKGRGIGIVSVSFSGGMDRSWRLRETFDAVGAALSLWAAGRRGDGAGGSAERRGGRGPTLTVRQAHVLNLVRAGRTNAEIASSLGCSVSTVKGDLAALFRLLGATDRSQLISLANRAGL